MQNDFEKQVQRQANDFSLNPRPEIWDLVEKQLPEKKRRRFAIWWWLLPTLLLGGLLGIFQFGDVGKNGNPVNYEEQEQAAHYKKNEPNTNIKKADTKTTDTTQNTVPALVSANKKNAEPLIGINEIDNKKEIKHLKVSTVSKGNELKDISAGSQISTSKKGNKIFNILTNKKTEASTKKTETKTQTQNFESDKIISAKNGISKKQTSTTNNDGNDLADNPLASSLNRNEKDIPNSLLQTTNTDTTLDKIAKTETTENVDTARVSAEKAIVKNTNKSNWNFTFASGFSNTVGKPLGSSYNLENNASANFLSSNGGVNQPINNLQKPNAGFMFLVGMNRKKYLNKKLILNTGLEYTYLSNNQKTGVFKDSLFAIGNNPVQNIMLPFAIVPNYYLLGNSQNYINHINLLNVIWGLEYTLKPNTSKPFSIYSNFVLGYQISTNWLQPDTKTQVLFNSNDYATKLNYGLRIGLNWQVSNKFSIGTFYEYNINEASTWQYRYYLHWQKFGATISIPLTNLKK